MWKALWMYSGIWRGSWTMNECLTIGRVMPVTSASWKPSVPIRSVRTWPVMKTVGTESMMRVGDRRHQVGRAGARGRERDADLARGLRVALGGVSGALLVARLDVLEVGVVDRVVRGQVGAAGDPEDVLDPSALSASQSASAARMERGMVAPVRGRSIGCKNELEKLLELCAEAIDLEVVDALRQAVDEHPVDAGDQERGQPLRIGRRRRG